MFIISKEQKSKLEDYIDKVDKNTDEYRDVKELSANLNIITKQARQDSKKIKNLRENNEALQLRVDSFSEKVETQEKQINEYRKDKEDVYSKVASDMYDNKIISEKSFNRITGWDNEKDKEKDDYER